ncbi:unnamed protein product [Dovyalis caffra]|uniref:Ribosomal protein S14 n=1 Tax=Dovyalis caffra TaxID=77055 RepID=A0AAV1R9Z0_9ROSI|nr:unnamed protein product [Dovyalis caffra]
MQNQENVERVRNGRSKKRIRTIFRFQAKGLSILLRNKEPIIGNRAGNCRRPA